MLQGAAQAPDKLLTNPPSNLITLNATAPTDLAGLLGKITGTPAGSGMDLTGSSLLKELLAKSIDTAASARQNAVDASEKLAEKALDTYAQLKGGAGGQSTPQGGTPNSPGTGSAKPDQKTGTQQPNAAGSPGSGPGTPASQPGAQTPTGSTGPASPAGGPSNSTPPTTTTPATTTPATTNNPGTTPSANPGGNSSDPPGQGEVSGPTAANPQTETPATSPAANPAPPFRGFTISGLKMIPVDDPRLAFLAALTMVRNLSGKPIDLQEALANSGFDPTKTARDDLVAFANSYGFGCVSNPYSEQGYEPPTPMSLVVARQLRLSGPIVVRRQLSANRPGGDWAVLYGVVCEQALALESYQLMSPLDPLWVRTNGAKLSADNGLKHQGYTLQLSYAQFNVGPPPLDFAFYSLGNNGN